MRGVGRFGLLAVVGLVSAWLGLGAAGIGGESRASAAVLHFTVQMRGSEEVPPVAGGAAIAFLSYDTVTRVMAYDITVTNNPSGSITDAHFHTGPRGVAGPVIINLNANGSPHISGAVTFTPSQAAALVAGNVYLNYHSTTNPGGFARGQVILPIDSRDGHKKIDFDRDKDKKDFHGDHRHKKVDFDRDFRHKKIDFDHDFRHKKIDFDHNRKHDFNHDRRHDNDGCGRGFIGNIPNCPGHGFDSKGHHGCWNSRHYC